MCAEAIRFGRFDLSTFNYRLSTDSHAGLYDFPAREYSYQGRWPSPDPAGLAAVDASNPQFWNRYAYALNNPLALTDPDGLDPCQGANNFAFSQAANGTGIFTEDDCTANGGGGNTPSGNGPTFGADNTPGCVPIQTDPLGNAPPSLNCNTDGSSGPGSIASSSNAAVKNPKIIDANGQPCTPSVLDPSCKPPACPVLFAKNWLHEVLGVDELMFHAAAEPTVKAATQAVVTKRIINRGLSTPLRSSVIRRYLLFGELAEVALLLPVLKGEVKAFGEEIDAWSSRKCTTIWTTKQ